MRVRESVYVCVGEKGGKGERERGKGDRIHICLVRLDN